MELIEVVEHIIFSGNVFLMGIKVLMRTIFLMILYVLADTTYRYLKNCEED